MQVFTNYKCICRCISLMLRLAAQDPKERQHRRCLANRAMVAARQGYVGGFIEIYRTMSCRGSHVALFATDQLTELQNCKVQGGKL